MKSRHLVAIALAAASFGMSSATWADGPMQRVMRAHSNAIQEVDDRREHRRDHRADRREDRRDWRAERREERRDWRADRREDRRDWRAERRHDRHYHAAPAVRHHHYHHHARGPEFKRGRYIPHEYRSRQYVVVNHHHHRLAAPPRGHHWVQVGGDYVLIAIATGLIANVILNH